MKDEEFVILFAIVALIGKYLYDHMTQINSINSLLLVILPNTQNWKIYLIIAIPFIFYFNYKINSWVKNKVDYKKEVEMVHHADIKEVQELLTRDLKQIRYASEINNYIDDLLEMIHYIKKYKRLKNYSSRLHGKITDAEIRIVELEEDYEIEVHRDVLEELKEEIHELEKEKDHREFELEQADDKALRSMNTHDNPVFIKSTLTKKQIDLLLKNGYSYLNEYCVEHGKIIQTLVKPESNHSKTHTFLVWSVMRYLHKLKAVSNVKDYTAVEADIVFVSNGEKYALEIETGTLLGKKFQLSQKVDYLNRKYKDRWMFIVSNKNLLPKYRKFGVATSRSELPKKLKKLLKITTQ